MPVAEAKSLTIFVVDDTPVCRRPMARLLSSEGYKPLCASNGQEAIDALKSVIPSLILLDLSMPVMDGIAFLKRLQGNPEWASLPVIVVSGESSHGPVREAKALGAREVLVKAHFSPDQLFASIRRHLAV